MSTLTVLVPGRRDHAEARRPRLVSRPLALVFAASFATLTSFYLLLAVTPLSAAAAGAGTAGAGLVTGALLLGTVAAELSVPALLGRYRYRTLIAAAAALMGVPVLALLSGGPLVAIAAVSLVRGFGFGLSTVMGALTAELLPPQRRGEGLGLYGVVNSVPGVVALGAGVWLAGHCGVDTVVLLAAATALAPLAAFWWLPGTADPRHAANDAARGEREGRLCGQPTGLLAGLRRPGQLRLVLLFALTTVAAGVVVSFLPLAAGASGSVAVIGLLVQALGATLGRWWAGRRGDRHGHAGLLAPGLGAAALGMMALIWLAAPVVIVGMCLFGIGFGVIQNATLVLMINRMPASGIGTASVLWNLAYDTGYGVGPVVFGLVVGHIGYSAGFAVTGALILAALPAGRRGERSAMEPQPLWQAVPQYRLRHRRSSTRCDSTATGT